VQSIQIRREIDEEDEELRAVSGNELICCQNTPSGLISLHSEWDL